MGVQFVLGRASMNHETEMISQLKQWRSQNPNGNFFYLVPEHIKFESEIDVLSKIQDEDDQNKVFASTSVQIFSFTRLAWYFLRNTSVLNKQNLSKTGLSMLITHLLNQLNKDDLVIFSDEQNQPGFAEKLAKQLLELRLSGLEVDDLKKLQKGAQRKHQDNLADKLADLTLIYEKFLSFKIDGEQSLLETYLDSAKLLELLEEYLAQHDLSNYYFLIDGFDQFNATELKIITILMQKAKEVMISLPLTDQASVQIPQTNALFYRTSKLYHRLRKLAKGQKIQVVWAKEARVNSNLQQLENYWINAHELTTNAEYELAPDEKEDITITQTIDRISEIKWVAAKIRRMMAESQNTEHPYEYSDFLILTPQTEKYQNLIEPIFNQFRIPLFTDLTQKMSTHPLVEFVLGIFDVQRHGFNYQSIMRFLKTELFVPELFITGRTLDRLKAKEAAWIEHHPNSKWSFDPEASELYLRQTATFRNTLDVVENYILEHGIHTLSDWKKEWIVKELGLKENETQEELLERERALVINRNANELRKQVVNLFEDFRVGLKKVETGLDFAKLLFDFMEKAHVAETLSKWQQAAIAIQEENHDAMATTLHGEAIDTTRAQQVWNQFCQLLDEYVFALGNEKFDAEMFVNIFQSGFESANYKRVPSTLDQVIFSKSNVLQMQNRKVCFIIGATADVMPMRIDTAELLTEDDRNVLNTIMDIAKISTDKYLPETCELRMAAEPFTNYLAFMSGSEKLFFTYPVNDTDGTDLQISPYVSEIKDALNLPIQKVMLTAPNMGPEIIDYVGTFATTSSELLNLCRQLKHDQKELSQEWVAIFNYIKQHQGNRLLQIFKSLNYQNEILPEQEADENNHKTLDTDLVNELYGNQIMGSISRLETFYKNPYEYFLKYGLKLKPRALYEPTSANVGDYFHNIMAVLIDELQSEGMTLSNLSSSDFDQILSKVIMRVDQLSEFNVFQQTARNRYLQNKLRRSAKKVSRAIYRQHHKKKIFSLKSEATFGFGSDAVLKGKKFISLTNPKDRLLLQGRLDRIDLVEDQNNNLYYNVADYKSGQIKTKLDQFLVKSLNGISLQLLTYLAILRDNQKSMLQMLQNDRALTAALKDAQKDQIKLGSAVYFHLGTPQLKFADYNAQNMVEAQSISDKNFVYDGLFCADVSDLSYIKALGTSYQNDEKIINLDNYKIKLSKGGLNKRTTKNRVYNDGQFNKLLNMDLLKISQATDAIFSGIIDLAPYRLGNATGLDYSDYLPIMTFDTFIGNEFNDLNSNIGDIWEQIESESDRWKQIKDEVEGLDTKRKKGKD